MNSPQVQAQGWKSALVTQFCCAIDMRWTDRWLGVLMLILVVASGLLPGRSDAAATAAPGYAVSDFATGFSNSGAGGVGPIGLAFDRAGNLLVANYVDGYIYRFPPTGGVASASNRLNAIPIPGTLTGLASTADGRLYLGRQNAQDVVEIDPSNGAVLRQVASGFTAIALQFDPLSGDLFVSPGFGPGSIMRVTGFANGPGIASTFLPLSYTDGLAFSPDGALYIAGNSSILRGTPTSTPGPATVVTFPILVPTVDGMAISANTQAPYLFGNRNDGIITRVDLSTTPITLTNIVTGGTRGDFVTVGPDGCIYATQTDRVIKVSNADGSCLAPPLGPLFVPGVQPPSNGNFAAFYVGIEREGRQKGTVEIEGRFRVGRGSDGIDPSREAVRLTIGTTEFVLAAGRISRNADGSFLFRDIVNGAYVALSIVPLDQLRIKGAYRIKVKVEGLDVTGLADPVNVSLSIGNDSGTTAAWPEK